MKLKNTLAMTLVTAFVGTAALAGAVIQNGDSAKGQILTNGDGMSLYIFDKDTPAVSNCYDDCAVKWPPVEASNSARPQGAYGIVLRTDGSRQWTHNGMPLYTWFKDGAPGDITGDGVKGVWHLARP